MIYDASVLKYEVSIFNRWVCLAWLATWGLVFGFSRFARCRARHKGGGAWAEWALLPAYECAILLKKVCLVLVTASYGFGFMQIENMVNHRVSTVLALSWRGFSYMLYTCTYIIVIYVLWAKSVGTVTLYRAVAVSIAVTVVTATFGFFSSLQSINEFTMRYKAMHNITVPQWPSLNLKAPGQDQLDSKSLAIASFYAGVASTILGVILVALIKMQILHAPRQKTLTACLYALWTMYMFLCYFSCWKSIRHFFGFYPTLLFSVVEGPLKYYIMLLDSRYWSSLSLSGDNSTRSVDALELAEPLLMDVAVNLEELRTSFHWKHVPHIPFARLAVQHNSVRLGQGSAASVYKATFEGGNVAVKSIWCEHMTKAHIRFNCYELMAANQLQGHANIVEHKGFSLSPPVLHIVMEACTSNLFEVLHGDVHQRPSQVKNRHQLSVFWRCSMALDVARGVAHIHQCRFVHRDLKSPNCLVNGSFAVKICDFGETITEQEAAADARCEANDAFIGSFDWAAPELLCAPRYYSKWSDVYALSLIIFECMSQQSLQSVCKATGNHGYFPDYVKHEGTPPLDRFVAEWGIDLCDLLNMAWREQPESRCEAQTLVSALDENGRCGRNHV